MNYEDILEQINIKTQILLVNPINNEEDKREEFTELIKKDLKVEGDDENECKLCLIYL